MFGWFKKNPVPKPEPPKPDPIDWSTSNITPLHVIGSRFFRIASRDVVVDRERIRVEVQSYGDGFQVQLHDRYVDSRPLQRKYTLNEVLDIIDRGSMTERDLSGFDFFAW